MTLDNKPFTIFLLSALGVVILGSMGVFAFKNKGNLFENIDYLRQKIAPAFNETTGFLVISYAVIICIGNVIMKTSPKYLASGGESQEEKTTGFVAWLQSKGLGWLPIFISVMVISLMTFLPINNKILKIGIIAIVLGGVIVAALFFNAIIKLFGGKESFTNVKEEFGHIVRDAKTDEIKPHNLKITVEVQKSAEGEDYILIKNDTGGEHSKEWKLDIMEEDLGKYDNIQLGNNGWSTSIELLYNPSPKYDVYYSTEVASKPGFLTSLKKLTDKTKQIDVTEITTQSYYFHLFPKDIKIFTGDPSPDKIENGAGYTTNPETGICTLGGEEKLAVGNEVFIFPPGGIKYDHSANKYRYKIEEITENNKKKIVRTQVKPWSGSGTMDDDEKIDFNKSAKMDVKLFTGDKQDFDAKYTFREEEKSEGRGPKFTIKNMQQFFGFDAEKVKDSVRSSYIAYYCLVWGSFLVYKIVTAFQKGDILSVLNPFSNPTLVPFIIAALVETLLIGQSHYSLNESDVSSNAREASPTFSYAVAGFSTRIATVVGFLSYILTHAKEG